MSLFNEMIPEVKQKFLADKEEYPNLHKAMMEDMNNVTLISDLSIRTAANLIEYLPHTESNNSFIIKLYKVFGQ
jgi:hypothetical protein